MWEFNRNACLGKIAQPLCSDYKAAWRACGDNKEMLIRLALQQQAQPYLNHACYENLGLTKQYIMDNYAEYINGNKTFYDVDGVKGYSYRLYVGYEDDFKVDCDVAGIMWSKGQITIPATLCPTVYISNGSDMHLSMDGFSSIRIYLFDESKVTIDGCDETCDVYIYKYSNRATVEIDNLCLGKVKIFNKQLKL